MSLSNRSTLSLPLPLVCSFIIGMIRYADAVSIPEDDEWRYEGGNFSMACSMFVTASYRRGFGSHWPPLNATEFTPKDVYQLALYADNTAPRFTAASCPTLVSSPRGSYCQIVGDIKLVRLYF